MHTHRHTDLWVYKMCVVQECGDMCHDMGMEVRGQLRGVHSCLPPFHDFWRSNLWQQAVLQVSLYIEPSLLDPILFFHYGSPSSSELLIIFQIFSSRNNAGSIPSLSEASYHLLVLLMKVSTQSFDQYPLCFPLSPASLCLPYCIVWKQETLK